MNSDKIQSTEGGNDYPSLFLPQEHHEQYEKINLRLKLILCLICGLLTMCYSRSQQFLMRCYSSGTSSQCGKNKFTYIQRKRDGLCINITISSVQSLSCVRLWPHESQYARPPCPSPTPGLHSDSRPLSQWCHPAISSSVVPFSSCPQSLPASESFPMSQLFAWSGQNTGVSASASFLP